MPTVSIIIPIYNAEKYLKKCISSVISQSYKDIEIILINDGSKDSSGTICDEMAQKDARVQVIHKHNEGVSFARNVGISKAQGEFVTFLDADDMMKNDCIELLVKNNIYPLVVCGYEKVGIIQGFDGPKASVSVSILNEMAPMWNHNPATWWWFVWGKLYRRDIIIDNEIFFKPDMIYLEDFCFVLEYLSCIKELCLLASHSIFHIIENSKYSRYIMDYNLMKNHMQIHENAISLLENKCNASFLYMRQRIAFRHFLNFANLA